MALPPDEAERLFWIEAYMAGALAEWQGARVHVQLALAGQGPGSRELLMAALRAMGLDDLVWGSGPAELESDASAAYDKRLGATRDG